MLARISILTFAAALLAGCASTPDAPRTRATNDPDAASVLSRAPGPLEDSPSPRLTPPRERSADATLTGLLQYAAANNPALRASYSRWEAALAQAPQAMSLPDPRLSYGYMIDSVETRVGPQEQRYGIMQPIPWPPKLMLRKTAAIKEAEAAFHKVSQTRLGIFTSIKRTYFELAYLRRAIAITKDGIGLLERLEQVAQTQFKSGSPFSNTLKAQVELGKLTDRLQSLEELNKPLQARLNAALGRDSSAPIPEPVIPDFDALDLKNGNLLNALLDTNPELLASGAVIEQRETLSRLARREPIPDLDLGVEYIKTGDARYTMPPDSGKDAVMATVAIRVPLWWGKHRAAIAEADAKRDAAASDHEDLFRELHADLQYALYQFQDAQRKIRLYRDTLLPQARGALRVTQQSYEAGNTTFLDLIDAQRLLLEFELEFERALANRAQQLAELEAMTGQSLAALGESAPHESSNASPTPETKP